jgi:epoxide hydrolase-like predicted phosphatase
MSKRAVIFDFGGVLMKTLDRSPRYAWDDRLGLPHGSVERVVHGSEEWRLAQVGLLPVADYWASVARALKIDDADVQQLAVDYFSADYLDKTLVELIEKLHVRGHAVALLSNDSPALLDKLHTLGIAQLFDPLIVSANIGVMKPDAQAYQAVLNALQLAPGEAIFVDDMPANVVGAQALGIHAVRYVDGMDLASALEPLLEN